MTGLNLAVVSLLLSFGTLASAKLPSMLLGRPNGGFNNVLHAGVENADADPYPYLVRDNFTQIVDHTNATDTRTYNQRYWYNPKYFNSAIINDGRDLVFLFIGGEGPESDKWAAKPDVTYLKWAAKYGAAVFDLEHRFFGKSRPINDMTTASLKLCTTYQAIEDLATFIRAMNVKHNFKNPKWVTFGGSYPGSLSAWFRLKHPELTVGAVASSALMRLDLDFFAYATIVERTITATDQLCAARVTQAFARMQQLTLSPEGRDVLNKKFKLDPPFNDKTTKQDINNFFGNVYNIYQGMIQYTYDGSNTNTQKKLTAAELCDVMNQETDDLVDNVYDLYIYYTLVSGAVGDISKFPNSYNDVMAVLNETDYDKMPEGDEGSARGWMWLCCNEIGYLQTTDGGRGMFGATLPINLFYDMCRDMFGDEITAEYVRDGNRRTMKTYGGLTEFKATNVILPLGLLDPWSSQAYYPSADEQAKGVHAVAIPGAAHCSDMYPVYDGEPTDLAQARDDIEGYLRSFIMPGGGTLAVVTTSSAPGSSTPGGPIPTTTSGTSALQSCVGLLAAFVPARILLH